MPTSLTSQTTEHLGDPFRGPNEPAEIGRALRRRPPQLSRGWRKAVVLVHVVGSVGWLGVTATFLVLTLALLGNRDAATLRSGYAMHELMVTWLARPTALLTLGTGLVLAFGTPWGLARHVGSGQARAAGGDRRGHRLGVTGAPAVHR